MKNWEHAWSFKMIIDSILSKTSQTFGWKKYSIFHIMVKFPIRFSVWPLWCIGPRLPSKISIVLLIYHVGWEAFIMLWHLYPSLSPSNNLVLVSAFGSGLTLGCSCSSQGRKKTYAMFKLLCQTHAWTLFHFASLWHLQDHFCYPPSVWFMAGEINHERNKAPQREKFSFLENATTIATATERTENNNRQKLGKKQINNT